MLLFRVNIPGNICGAVKVYVVSSAKRRSGPSGSGCPKRAWSASKSTSAKRTPPSFAASPKRLEPAAAPEVRTFLRARFSKASDVNLKDLLASAPLEGVDLERAPDWGRAFDL